MHVSRVFYSPRKSVGSLLDIFPGSNAKLIGVGSRDRERVARVERKKVTTPIS